MCETGSHSIPQKKVQLHNHSSLHPKNPRLNWSSCLCLPSSWIYRHRPQRSANFIYLCFLEMGSQYVVQAGLKLQASNDPPASTFWEAGIPGASYWAWLQDPAFKTLFCWDEHTHTRVYMYAYAYTHTYIHFTSNTFQSKLETSVYYPFFPWDKTYMQ